MTSRSLTPPPSPDHASGSGPRVMVIGLDGATWQLARPWAEAGHLPTFRRLMEEGAWGALESVLPPVTPAAWSSFATGLNLGKHGIFDFVERPPDSYTPRLVNAHNRDGLPMWQLAGHSGRRVTVFNVPATYPPDRVPDGGLMVSGFLTPAHATDASWPPEVQAELAQAVPSFTFYPPTIYSPGHEAEFAAAVADLNQATLEAVRYLLRRQPWELFVTVFMGTDVIQHFMWGDMLRGQGPTASAILDCYRQMDAVLAELVDGLGPDDYLLVVSDHGFGPLTHYVHINAWLVDRGYLRFRRSPLSAVKFLAYRLGFTPLGVYEKLRALGLGKRMQSTASKRNEWMKAAINRVFLSFSDVDWRRTRAYSLGFGAPIFVNLCGREPQGIVQPGAEYEALLEELTDDLMRMSDPSSGELLVDRVHRREELYTGPHADRAPDLAFEPRNWSHQPFGLHELGSRRWLEPSRDRSGTHRLDGLFLIWGPGVRRGAQVQGAAIVDIAPTVLALLRVPIPDNVDGQVLTTALEDGLVADLDVTYTQADKMKPPSESVPGMSHEDEQLMREHLRGLGYVA